MTGAYGGENNLFIVSQLQGSFRTQLSSMLCTDKQNGIAGLELVTKWYLELEAGSAISGTVRAKAIAMKDL